MSEIDPAARAFDDLRAEVSVLRRAVGEGLKAVEATPMLKSEPSAYRYAVEQAGMAASHRMQNTFDGAIR